MDTIIYRMLLTGVAIGPAVILALTPVIAIGASIGIAISAMGSGFALFASLRKHPKSVRRTGPVLLRRSSARRARRDLPPLDVQHRALADFLSATVAVREDPEAPPTRATAVARVLSRMLSGWKVTDLRDLPNDLTAALTLLERLLNAEPGEAGRLAQYFQRPDLVLGLRDEIDRIARTRDRYDRAFAAFEATRVMQAAYPAPRSLGEALESLGSADPDLWHRVVLEHDPMDPEQRDAALWCVSRPNCDRASLAAYFARLPEGAQLQNAALDGDEDFLTRVKHLISRCNASYYTVQEIAYTPPPDAAARLSRELDALAALTGEPRWPDPQCALVPLEGRAPRARPAWDLAKGRLIAPPHRADYL